MLLGRWTAVAATFALLLAVAAWYQPSLPAITGEEPDLYTQADYKMTRIADQFSAPVGVAVGKNGDLYIAEAGLGNSSPPRVIKWAWGNQRSTLATDFPAPLTGIALHGGKLYVSYTGGVDLLDPVTGVHHSILSKLPAGGDYANTAPSFGPDGKLYFGIGAATNAGVVGEDNIRQGWVQERPKVHDIPCKDLTLRGSNFSIANTLTSEPQDLATTGGFSPFGTTTARLQTISGAVPCTAAVLRANPDGTAVEVFAWGLRHPAGLAFGPDGQLYATVQGYEERGSRPVVGDRDYLYLLERDRWYGWPDFAGGKPLTAEEFQKPSMPVHPLLAKPPEQPPLPVLAFEPESGARGILFPPESFGLRGEALIALSGARGRLVIRVNPRSGTLTAFAMVRDRPSTPWALTAGADSSVYIVDVGETRMTSAGTEPVPGTGSILRITRATAPQGGLLQAPKGARSADAQWHWALVGLVLSIAGVGLVRDPRANCKQTGERTR